MGVISVLWVFVGFSLSFGEDLGGLGIIGNPSTYLMFHNVGGAATDNLSMQLGLTIPLALYALFQMKFAIITPSLITGSFAERVRFSSYMVFMALFCIFVYCPLAHMTWHPDGLFAKMHVKDFAGGITVHASSGVAALVGAIFLGRRKEKKAEPANVPYVILGAVLFDIEINGKRADKVAALLSLFRSSRLLPFPVSRLITAAESSWALSPGLSAIASPVE